MIIDVLKHALELAHEGVEIHSPNSPEYKVCAALIAALEAKDEIDWKDMYEKEKRRSEMWVAKYEKDIGPLEKAVPQQEKNEFNPDWDTQAVLTEEIQRMAKRIEELEAKDEPVAWAFFFEDGEASNELFDTREQGEKWLLSDDCLWAGSLKPLYTTPPQRKPLTDEEIEDMWQQYCKQWKTGEKIVIQFVEFARAIEAAHGITGEKK